MSVDREGIIDRLLRESQRLIHDDVENVITQDGEMGVYRPDEFEDPPQGFIAGLAFAAEGFALYSLLADGVIREDGTSLTAEEIGELGAKFDSYNSNF